MIVTVARKEWRQQGLLAAAIVLLAGVAIGTAMLALPREWANLPREGTLRATLFFALATLAISQGVVTGSLLFAGEREEGTLPFLDQLAGERQRVWFGKTLAGLAVVVVVSLALGATMMRVGIGSLGLVALCVWFALDAFAWAALASAVSETTFRAIGLALLFLLVVAGGPLQWLTNERETLYFALKIPTTFAALGLSYATFCARDHERGPRVVVERAPSLARLALTFAWGQTGFVGVACAAGLSLLGLLLVARAPMVVWASLAPLVVGAVCGWCAFAGTQAEHAERFLGDQRFPPGRAWVMLSGPWAALATLVCGGVAIYAALYGYRVWHHDDSRVDGMSVFWSRTGVAVVLACGLTGYACASFWMQRFRKLPVAGLITLVTAGPAALIWIPSLIAGLPEWVPFVPALVLLGLTRLDFARWTSGRLSEWRGIANSLGGVVLSIGWGAGWLAWRAYGIPVAEAPFDVAAFQRELNDPERTRRGFALSEATRALEAHANRDVNLFPLSLHVVDGRAARLRRESDRPIGAGEGAPGMVDEKDAVAAPIDASSVAHVAGPAELASLVIAHGWPKDAGPVGDWLDGLAGKEVDAFAEAVRAPTGEVQLPIDPHRGWMQRPSEGATVLFELRAFQHAAAGRHDAAVADWRIAAASARHRLFRSQGPASHFALNRAWAVAETLDRLVSQSPVDDLPKWRDAVDEHLAAMPRFVDCARARWLAQTDAPMMTAEPILGGNLWAVTSLAPYERMRATRLGRSWLRDVVAECESREFCPRTTGEGANKTFDDPISTRLWLSPSSPLDLDMHWQRHGGQVSHVRCVRVALAAMTYRSETGRDPATVADLVPKHLPAIPLGVSGQPLELTIANEAFLSSHPELHLRATPGQWVVRDVHSNSNNRIAVPVPKGR